MGVIAVLVVVAGCPLPIIGYVVISGPEMCAVIEVQVVVCCGAFADFEVVVVRGKAVWGDRGKAIDCAFEVILESGWVNLVDVSVDEEADALAHDFARCEMTRREASPTGPVWLMYISISLARLTQK